MIKLKQINVSDNLFLYYHKNLSVEIHSREAGIYVSSCDVQKLIQALQQVQKMKESEMSYKVDGYEVEFIKYGFIGILDFSTNQYIVIDTKEQARDVAFAILEKCQERELESEE